MANVNVATLMDVVQQDGSIVSNQQAHNDEQLKHLRSIKSAPQEAEEEQKKARYAALQKFRFSAKTPIPKPETIISVEGNVIATPGNIISFVGQAKSGKSGLVSGITAGVLAIPDHDVDTLGFTIKPNTEGKAFIHIDSEQSNYNHSNGMMKVLARAGRDKEPEWFHSYSFKRVDIKERSEDIRMLFEVCAEMHGGVHMVVIDGGADLVFDTNDAKESNINISLLESLADQYNCVIVIILHFNPGSTIKGRGHYGSQLERKCESVISVTKDEETEISTIKGAVLRNSGIIPNLQFKYDVEKGYHVYCGTLTKESKADKKINNLQSLATSIFEGDKKRYSYTELYKKIMVLEDLQARAAKNRVKDMVDSNLIFKVDGEEVLYHQIINPINSLD
jgi:hypothetical protein